MNQEHLQFKDSARAGLRRAAALFVVVLAVSGAMGQDQTNPTAPPPETKVERPRQSGPNMSNLMPPTRRETRVRSIPNPVIRTNGFPMGLDNVYVPGTSCTSPYLLHTGGGQWVQYGYPFPLDLSWQNLQPGQMVQIPAPTWWRTQYEGYPLSETQRRVDPADALKSVAVGGAVQPPVVGPLVDEGREALRAHDYDRAIAIYERRHEEQTAVEAGSLTGPLVDRTALRLLAVSLVGAGRMDEGERVLTRAQAEDASLALQPLDGDDFIGSRRELRRLVTDAVKFAKSKPSPESWELVAVLMEAEGRVEVAAKMREKGREPVVPPKATLSAPAKESPGPASFTMPLPKAE